MTDVREHVPVALPELTDGDVKDSTREPSLADGDYTLIGVSTNGFKRGRGGKYSNAYFMTVIMMPLTDPNDGASGRRDLSVMVTLAHPGKIDKSLTSEADKVPTRILADTVRFFRSLAPDAVPVWPAFKQKGQTAAEFDAARDAALRSILPYLVAANENPAVVKKWLVNCRVRTRNNFKNYSYYDDQYLKSVVPPWSPSKPKAE